MNYYDLGQSFVKCYLQLFSGIEKNMMLNMCETGQYLFNVWLVSINICVKNPLMLPYNDYKSSRIPCSLGKISMGKARYTKSLRLENDANSTVFFIRMY